MELQKNIIQPATPEEFLQLGMDKMALEITSKWDNIRLREREAWDHSAGNWCSEIHHPCIKHLTHCRRDWKEKQLPDISSLYRFEEGNDKEQKIKNMLGDIGYELNKSQVRFKLSEYQLSGKIDGTLTVPAHIRELLHPSMQKLAEFPVEIKSTSPHFWNSTETILDLKKHPKFWINKIPSQLNLYLLMMEKPGGFIILVTFGKRPRIIPMLIDYDLGELDIKKAEAVNAHIAAGTYPEPIPFDATVCAMCGFDHLCNPLKTAQITELTPSDEIELQLYLELKEWYQKFKEAHKELIGDKKKPGRYFGQTAFINDIEISTSRFMRKAYKYPEEVKEQHRVDDIEVISTSIDRVAP